MSLQDEVDSARKHVVTDGYDMSIGEIINLYKDEEIIINPDFQRYFRWKSYQKTRFIESLLLGIPIPPIFVFQDSDGKWELIDGLQRLSTIFEFLGILRSPDDGLQGASRLKGTNFLPSLSGKCWDSSDSDINDGIGKTLQLQMKRARIRVEILKSESDSQAKYELFQRLNTGGSNLSEQEVRNCVALMINRTFYDWLKTLASKDVFMSTISQTDNQLDKQSNLELALKFFVFRNVAYDRKLGVHEYLDKALIELATNEDFDMESEGKIFIDTFKLSHEVLGSNVFKKWDGSKFTGKVSLAAYEVIATGISKQLDSIHEKSEEAQKVFIEAKVKKLWSTEEFKNKSGAGVSGTERLSYLIPLANSFFCDE